MKRADVLNTFSDKDVDFTQFANFEDFCRKFNLTPEDGRKLVIDAAIRRGLF